MRAPNGGVYVSPDQKPIPPVTVESSTRCSAVSIAKRDGAHMGAQGGDIASGKAQGIADAPKPEQIGAASLAMREGVRRGAGLARLRMRAGGAPPQLPTTDERGLTGTARVRLALGAALGGATRGRLVIALQGIDHAW